MNWKRVRYHCLSVFMLLITVDSAFADRDNGPFSLQQILNTPFPSALTAARDGSDLAWVFNTQGADNIWLASGPGYISRQITQFTDDDGQRIHIVGFLKDRQFLLFTRGSMFNPASSPEGPPAINLFKLDCSSGEIIEIPSGRNVVLDPVADRIAYIRGQGVWTCGIDDKPRKIATIRGDIRFLSWAPDGSRLLIQTSRGNFPHRYSYIAYVELSDESLVYIDPSVYFDAQPAWSPNGHRIAFIRRLTHGHQNILTARTYPRPDPWEVRIAELGRTGSATVWTSPPDDTFEAADVLWLNNTHLVFSSEAGGWKHLYMLNSDSGKTSAITQGRWEVESFVTDTQLENVFFTANIDDIDRRHIWQAGTNGRAKMITPENAIQWNPVISGDRKHLAFFASSAILPAQVYVRDLATARSRILAPHSLPADFPKHLILPEQVIMTSADGRTLHGQLFVPSTSYTGKRPALMYFHGGPIRQMLLGFHYSSYYHRCYAMNQYMASRGYVVLSVNYRLGIGYGKAFRDVENGGPRGGSEYQDLLAGAAFLRSHPRVHPKRVGLWGGSYGGLMTALGLAKNSDLFAAGVDLHGVHDWNQWQAWAENRAVEFNQAAWKSSPLADVQYWRSPVLLIHGDDDRNVPFSETIWLADTLKNQGVDVRLLVFPDDIHNFLLYRNWLKAFSETASFFDQTLNRVE